MRLEKYLFATGKFWKMQLAKCKMQNAKCKMQNAKCKMQNEIAVSNRSSLTCSYLQTTSSHFVPRLVSPSKFKILFWVNVKNLAISQIFCQCCPKVQKPKSVQFEHEANLGVESIKALNFFVSLHCFAKQVCITNNVPILMKKTLHPVKHVIYHCQHPILLSHCCAIFGRFNKQVPNLGFVILMVCLQTCGEYIVYNDTQLTLQGLAQACKYARRI